MLGNWTSSRVTSNPCDQVHRSVRVSQITVRSYLNRGFVSCDIVLCQDQVELDLFVLKIKVIHVFHVFPPSYEVLITAHVAVKCHLGNLFS